MHFPISLLTVLTVVHALPKPEDTATPQTVRIALSDIPYEITIARETTSLPLEGNVTGYLSAVVKDLEAHNNNDVVLVRPWTAPVPKVLDPEQFGDVDVQLDFAPSTPPSFDVTFGIVGAAIEALGKWLDGYWRGIVMRGLVITIINRDLKEVATGRLKAGKDT